VDGVAVQYCGLLFSWHVHLGDPFRQRPCKGLSSKPHEHGWVLVPCFELQLARPAIILFRWHVNWHADCMTACPAAGCGRIWQGRAGQPHRGRLPLAVRHQRRVARRCGRCVPAGLCRARGKAVRCGRRLLIAVSAILQYMSMSRTVFCGTPAAGLSILLYEWQVGGAEPSEHEAGACGGRDPHPRPQHV
jgi:hypothetical protein